MSKPNEEVKTCELCGATIYPEHIKRGAADRWGGKLLCPHCLQEKKLIAAVNPAAAYAGLSPPVEQKPIAIVLNDEPETTAAPAASPIRAFGDSRATTSGGSRLGMPAAEARFRRPLLPGSPNATRCRTFHCKLTDAAMAHLSDTINEWVDSGDDIEIKFATSSVGIVEMKSSSEPHLFVTVFY